MSPTVTLLLSEYTALKVELENLRCRQIKMEADIKEYIGKDWKQLSVDVEQKRQEQWYVGNKR